MLEPQFAAVALIVFFAFFTQAATGFGAMIIALTVSALFYPVPVLLSWFLPLVLLLSIYLLARHHAHIAWSLLLKRVLPGMGAGLVLGQAVFYSLNTGSLKLALGVLVVALAMRELLRNSDAPQQAIPLLPWTFAAGIVHGVFATGGPLLVYGLNGQKLSKGAFRSTLALVWLTMALILNGSFLISGQLNATALQPIGLLALILPASIVLGEFAHRRINEGLFRRIINILLVFCGLVLLLSAI